MTVKEMKEDIIIQVNPFGFVLFKDYDFNSGKEYIFISDLYNTPSLGISKIENKKFFKVETAVKWIKKQIKEHIKDLKISLNELK